MIYLNTLTMELMFILTGFQKILVIFALHQVQ